MTHSERISSLSAVQLEGHKCYFIVSQQLHTNRVFWHLKARKILNYYYREVEFKNFQASSARVQPTKRSSSSQLVKGYYGVRSRSDGAPHAHKCFSFVCVVQQQIIGQSTKINYGCNLKVICFKFGQSRKLASLEQKKKPIHFPNMNHSQ